MQPGSSSASRRRFLGAWVLVLVLAAAFFRSVIGTPLIIVQAAVLPALLYSLVLVRIDRYEREPARLLLATFLWGAVVAAGLSSAGNEWVRARLAAGGGEAAAALWTAVFAAPVVEELSKMTALAALLLCWRDEIDGALDGMIYGALVGMGFAMTENIFYFTMAAVQGGTAGLLRSVYVRAVVEGFNHAAFSAASGAGIGYACAVGSRRARIAAPLGGLAAAVLQHVAWNGLASPVITESLCGAGLQGRMCLATPPATHLFGTLPLVVLAFLGPGALVLGAIAILSLQAQRRRRALGARTAGQAPFGPP